MKICKRCRNCIVDGRNDYWDLYCRAVITEKKKHISPLTGKVGLDRWPHPYCKDINKDGNCDLYEDILTNYGEIKRDLKLLWQWVFGKNLKGKTLLVLARVCWWIGGVRDLRP